MAGDGRVMPYAPGTRYDDFLGLAYLVCRPQRRVGRDQAVRIVIAQCRVDSAESLF